MKIAIIIGAVILFSALCVVRLFLIRRTLYNMIDRRIERFQSELIEKQVREIQNMYRQVRGWRHDYRNHINNMKIQLSEGNYDKLSDYLNELADDLDTVDTVIKTGNVMADAILNSKLNVAEKMNIKLNVKANVPDKLPMSDVELCSMLGNILDNAVEACGTLPEEDSCIFPCRTPQEKCASRKIHISPPKRVNTATAYSESTELRKGTADMLIVRMKRACLPPK